MPVCEDSSIVLDSTLSSSPLARTPAVKRAVRIYGRPRVVDDSDTYHLDSTSTSEPRPGIYQTGPPGIGEEIPPSSDPARSLSDTEPEGVDNGGMSHDIPRQFQFDWRQKLREIDEQEDFGVEQTTVINDPNASPLRAASPGQSYGTLASPAPADSCSNNLAEDIFGGSLTALPASPPLRPLSFTKSPSHDATPVHQRSSRNARRVIQDSDSENEGIKGSSPYSNATTKLQSSSTPPTSDNEGPGISERKRKTKPRPDVGHFPLPEELINIGSIQSQKRSKDKRNKKLKVKVPTKRELAETARDRVRIAADQQISIPRTEVMHQKYTIHNLFARIAPDSNLQPGADLDPIREFSPDDPQFSPRREDPPVPLYPFAKQSRLTSPLHGLDGKDCHKVASLITQEERKCEDSKRLRDLLESKKQILAAQKVKRHERHSEDDDSDDELEVVQSLDMQLAVKEEDAERKSGRKKRLSEGRKMLLNLARVSTGMAKARESPVKGGNLQSFKSDKVSRGGGKQGEFKTYNELNQFMVKRVETASMVAIRKKEADWIELGGKLRTVSEVTSSTVHEATKAYAQKGLKVMNGEEVDSGSEVGSDEDWKPGDTSNEKGFPTPSSKQSSSGDDEAHEGGNEAAGEDADITMVNEEDDITLKDDELDVKLLVRRRAHHVIHSDSDGENISPTRTTFSSSTLGPLGPLRLTSSPSSNDGNVTLLGPPKSLITGHRGSMSSLDDPTEDEGDKENDTSRVWDREENKENKAVVRYTAMGRQSSSGARTRTLHDSGTGPSRITTSPESGTLGHFDNDFEGNRRPLKDFSDVDPFTSQAELSRSPTSFVTRLQLSSPMDSHPLTAGLSFVPFISAKGVGFSQFNDELLTPFGAEPLQPGFDPGTEESTRTKKKSSGLFGQSRLLSEEPELKDTPKSNFAEDLQLTQDVTLQPDLQVGGNLLRRADQIFEKEQEYLLEAATKKPQNRPELYINDHGFLTQTRPDISSPEVYKISPPAQSMISGGLPQRHPLRTLSFVDSTEFDSPAPLRRLQKRAVTPKYSSLVKESASDAFGVMKSTSKSERLKPRQKLQKSDFVESEAQESDDDDMLGFGPRVKGDEGEEEGEDLDKTLETLVDDQEMDEATVGADLVMEKYQEHVEIDDRENEKIHQAAIHGDLRKKKRGHGVGMEDSDDDSDEDDDNRKLRRGMYKKQRIDRDNIKELGEHPETRSFYEVYEHDLNADSTEFGYLLRSQPTEDAVMADEDRGEEPEPFEYVSHEEIKQRARRVAQHEEVLEDLDPHDVTWVEDQSDNEENIHVRPVTATARKPNAVRSRRLDQPDFDIGIEDSVHKFDGARNVSRLQSWAKTEGKSRTLGTTGRSVGGAAVTGHKVKTGGGSLRNVSVAEPSSNTSSRPNEQRRSVKAKPSLLAGLAAERRKTQFK